MGVILHEPPVAKRERFRRVSRLAHRRTWRSLLLGVTDPVNDRHWDFVRKQGTPEYLSDPEPWLAPGVTEAILERLSTGARVFEWGAGSSTLWFVANGFSVVAYETHQGWAKDVSERAGGRAEVVYVGQDDGYASPTISDFALVLIDGRRRNACGKYVAEAGEGGLVVVFDDSHRPAYREAMEALSARAAWQRHYPGLSSGMMPKMTSIFVL